MRNTTCQTPPPFTVTESRPPPIVSGGVPYLSRELDQRGLTVVQFRIVGHIARRAGSGVFRASIRGIARITGFCDRTVRRAVSRLIDQGLIAARGVANRRGHRLRLSGAAVNGLRVPAHIDNSGLTPRAFRVLLHVVSCESGTLGCSHSLRGLHCPLRMHALTLDDAISDLIADGWLDRKPGGVLTTAFFDPEERGTASPALLPSASTAKAAFRCPAKASRSKRDLCFLRLFETGVGLHRRANG